MLYVFLYMRSFMQLALGLVLVTTTLVGCANTSVETRTDLSLVFNETVPATIFYDFDKSNLDAQARAVLDAQAAFIKDYPSIWFSVAGHADRVGSSEYNKALGLRRANTALEYLVKQGVDPLQLEAIVSFGEQNPAVETEERERRNRRVVTSVGGIIDPECNCRKRPNL